MEQDNNSKKQNNNYFVNFNPNDKFLYHRDFADVYENNEGKRYYVYDEDKIPTTSYNQSRQNLEKPLHEHIQKQYKRNPQGMKTIEDAVKWGGDVAGLSLATVGLAPYFLPRVAPTVVNGAKNFFKVNEQLFNPTTYHGAALTSAFAANEMNNFVNNPNFENGFWAGLSTIPLAKPIYTGAKATYDGIKNTGQYLYKNVYRPVTFPIRNKWRQLHRNTNNYDDLTRNYNTQVYMPVFYPQNTSLENGKYVFNLGPTFLNHSKHGINKVYYIVSRQLQDINPELRNQVNTYRTQLQSLIGEDGVIGGSTLGISRGYINNVLNGDTEIITTRSRLQSLIDKLKFVETRTNSIGGISGTSPLAKGKTNNVEFDFIEAAPNGNAVGTQAHSIYSVLHPEERAKVVNSVLTRSSYNPIHTDRLELPISAEQLYQEFINAPQEIKDLVHIVDMLGAGRNVAREENAYKHAERAWNLLLNQEHIQQVSKAIDILGRKWFGSNYKVPNLEYPNLKFDNPQDNREFIETIINTYDEKIPNSKIEEIIHNPEWMKNIFNYWYQNNLIGTRVVKSPNQTFTPSQTWDVLFNNIHSVGGGTGSGIGRNHTTGKITAFKEPLSGSVQSLITFHPEDIKSLSQFTNKFHEISNPNIINDFSIYKGYNYNSALSPSQDKEILDRIISLDRPIVRSTTTERGVGAYNGSYLGINYPNDFTPSFGQRPYAVANENRPEFGFAFSPQFNNNFTKELFYNPNFYSHFYSNFDLLNFNNATGNIFVNLPNSFSQITIDKNMWRTLKNNGFKVNFRGTPNHDLYKYIRKVLKTYSSQELNKKQIKDLTNNDFYNIRLKLDELTKEGRATRENRLHERQILQNKLKKYQNNYQNFVIKPLKLGTIGTTVAGLPLGIAYNFGKYISSNDLRHFYNYDLKHKYNLPNDSKLKEDFINNGDWSHYDSYEEIEQKMIKYFKDHGYKIEQQ